MTTGAAATSRSARKYSAAAAPSNITPTKNTRRRSRSRSKRAAREIYTFHLKKCGRDTHETYGAVTNLASTLFRLGHYSEAKSLLREKVPSSRWINRNSEPEVIATSMRANAFLAMALVKDKKATPEEVREGVKMLQDTVRRSERVLGQDHPMSAALRRYLENMTK